jgi:uncharacterized protein (TIGR04222 family)
MGWVLERRGLATRVAIAGATLMGAVVLGALAEQLVSGGRPVAGRGEPSAGATWGIDGPDFVALYGAAVLLAAVAVLVLRHRVWAWHDRRLPVGSEVEPSEPVEIAYLTGGPRHAVLVAHLRLHELGLVEVPDHLLQPDCTYAELVEAAAYPVRLRAGGPSDPSPRLHPVEARVSALLGEGHGYEANMAAMVASPELAAVHDGLQVRGLLVDADVATRLQRTAIVPAAVVALGTARLMAGTRNHRPVEWLILLLMAASALLIAAVVAVPVCSPRGRRLAASFQRNSPSEGGPLAVAMLGTAGTLTVSAGLAASFGIMPPRPNSGGGTNGGGGGGGCGGGGGGDGGGGGGCGGGGCGGGGCGG